MSAARPATLPLTTVSAANWNEQALLDIELDVLRGHMGELAPTFRPGLLAWKLDDMVIFGFHDDPDGTRWLNWQGCGWHICRLDADTDRVSVYHDGTHLETHELPAEWRRVCDWG